MQNWKTSARTTAKQSSKSSLLFRQAALAAILLLAAVILVSCDSTGSKIVIAKSYLSYTGGPMPNGICRFFYEQGNNQPQEFQDSCNKYNVGDTLIGRSVNSR